jgi:hypothetical protein
MKYETRGIIIVVGGKYGGVRMVWICVARATHSSVFYKIENIILKF